MTCKQARKIYLEHAAPWELPFETKELIIQHLRACPACTELYHSASRLPGTPSREAAMLLGAIDRVLHEDEKSKRREIERN